MSQIDRRRTLGFSIVVLFFFSSLFSIPVSASPTVTLKKIGVVIYTNNLGASVNKVYLASDRSGMMIKYFRSLGLLNAQPVFMNDDHNQFDLLVYDDSARRIFDDNFTLVNNSMKWAHGNGSNIYVGWEVFFKSNLTTTDRQWPMHANTFWYLEHFGVNTELRGYSSSTYTLWFNQTAFQNLFGISVPEISEITQGAYYIQNYDPSITILIKVNGTGTDTGVLMAYKDGVLLDPNGFLVSSSLNKFRTSPGNVLFSQDEALRIWEYLAGDEVNGRFDVTISYAGFKDAQMVIALDDAPRYNHSALNAIASRIGGKVASLMAQGNRMNLGDLSQYEYRYFTEFDLHSLNHSNLPETATKEQIKWDMLQTISVIEGNLSYTKSNYVWRSPGGWNWATNLNITDAVDDLYPKVVGTSDFRAEYGIVVNNYYHAFPYITRLLRNLNGTKMYNFPRSAEDLTWLRDASLTREQKIEYAYENYTNELDETKNLHGVWIMCGHEADEDAYPELLERLLDYAKADFHVTTLRGAWQTQLTFNNLEVTFDGSTLTVRNNWEYESVPVTVNLHTSIGKVIYQGKNWLLHNGTAIQIPPIPPNSQITMTISSSQSPVKMDEIITGAWIWEAYENNGNIEYNMSQVLNLIGTFTLANGLKIQAVSNVYRITSIRHETQRLSFTILATSGSVSTTKVYCGSLGKPAYIDGALSWDYDRKTRVLTVTAEHHSPVTIEVGWYSQPVLPVIRLAPLMCSLLLIGVMALNIKYMFDKMRNGEWTLTEDMDKVFICFFVVVLCIGFIMALAEVVP